MQHTAGRFRLSIKPENSDDGKEDSYERNPGGVSVVFNLSFSELLRVQKNLYSLSKTLFRQAGWFNMDPALCPFASAAGVCYTDTLNSIFNKYTA
jgi:hypothetical protein